MSVDNDVASGAFGKITCEQEEALIMNRRIRPLTEARDQLLECGQTQSLVQRVGRG
jgi:hypothetical protein